MNKDFSDPLWILDFVDSKIITKMTVKYDPVSRDSFLQFYDANDEEVRNCILPLEPKKGSYQREKFHPHEQ